MNSVLSHAFKKSRLSNSCIIATQNVSNALQKCEQFVQDCILNDIQSDLRHNPDYMLVRVDEKSKVISIDQIREFKAFLQKTAMMSYKVGILYEADLMNINAANSCLKILEEPTLNSYIFLITNRINQIPITVRSRCAVFKDDESTIYEPSIKYDEVLQLFYSSVSVNLRSEIIKKLSHKNPSNNQLFYDIGAAILELISKLVKKRHNIDVSLDYKEELLFLRSQNIEIQQLLQKAQKIDLTLQNVAKYDLDLVTSFITMIEECGF